MMTVFVLVVLWLIVVVPMLLRRGDERRQDRSVAGFGRAMRALGRRARSAPGEAEVYVPGRSRADLPTTPAVHSRRPTPVAQEALMYPVDRADMSAARTQMMARRRRSLATLVGGTLLFTVIALARGGMMWLLSVAFIAGLVGYLFFLRSQALRDRERRANRLARATRRGVESYDVTEEPERFAATAESVVRIDDDDIELQSMDTIDLTDVYAAEVDEPAAQRRAS
jgi:hypothetical protein